MDLLDTVRSDIREDIWQFLHAITKEMLAREEDRTWPRDAVRAAAIVLEEAAELLGAANDLYDASSKLSSQEVHQNMMKEATQTGAMALRFWWYLGTYTYVARGN